MRVMHRVGLNRIPSGVGINEWGDQGSPPSHTRRRIQPGDGSIVRDKTLASLNYRSIHLHEFAGAARGKRGSGQ
jgi:hypothetical protein